MKDVAIIMYSHSEYSDAWQMFFGQAKKYLSDIKKKYILTDKALDLIPDDWAVIEYKNEDSYSKRVASCLQEVEEEYCIFHHEDMPLYKAPDIRKLKEFKDFLDEEEDISYIKLVKGGLYPDNHVDVKYKDCDNLFSLDEGGNFVFAVQPSLWKTEDLLKLYKITKINHIGEFETNATEICRYMKIKGLYCYMGEDKRGMFHWDSNVYPYICTAISKGKWNTSEYGKELTEIFKECSIDPSVRGEI
jgi:hypothetical protein